MGKYPPCDKAAALKLAQTLRKSLLGDAGNGALQSIESRLAFVIAKCAEDQKIPASGDLLDHRRDPPRFRRHALEIQRACVIGIAWHLFDAGLARAANR